MEKVILKNLVRAVNGKFIYGDPKQPIISVSTDTRKLCSGDIFFALKGKNYDAHQFIVNAIKEGVSGLVVSQLSDEFDNYFSDFSPIPSIILVDDTLRALGDFAKYYRQQFSPVVIGVTGSNGKTTTKEMIHSILSSKNPTLANIDSYNNFIGLPLSLFDLKAQYKYCILELGVSLPGEMDRLIEISQPHIGVVTNIGRTHLEFLNNVDGVFREKRKLVEFLPENGKAIINIDDTYLNKLVDTLDCEVITYGFNPSAKIKADNVRVSDGVISFNLHLPAGSTPINLYLNGKFNIYNALASSAVGFSLGIDIETIRHGLENFKPPCMRMEKFKVSRGSIIINDAYNANPDSMRESVLSFIRLYPDRKKIIVLGDMLELGQHALKEHVKLGEFLSNLSTTEPFHVNTDKIYLYGNGKMAKSIMNGINAKIAVKYFDSSEDLIAQLKSELKSSHFIFLKASRAVGLEKIANRLLKKSRNHESATG